MRDIHDYISPHVFDGTRRLSDARVRQLRRKVMAVTCDRCSKPTKMSVRLTIEHEGRKAEVWLTGGDYCQDCFSEIVRNGTVVEENGK